MTPQVRSMHNILGGVIDAHASYLLLRGMKTLGLRVAHQNRTGAPNDWTAVWASAACAQPAEP